MAKLGDFLVVFKNARMLCAHLVLGVFLKDFVN